MRTTLYDGDSIAVRAFIGIAPRANGGAMAGRPVEKMLDNMSGARDVVISVALYLLRYNVFAHIRSVEKGHVSASGERAAR